MKAYKFTLEEKKPEIGQVVMVHSSGPEFSGRAKYLESGNFKSLHWQKEIEPLYVLSWEPV